MRVLVIVDMQNDFIDDALGSPEAQAIVPNIIAKAPEYIDALTLFTKDTHYENYLDTLEGQKLPVPHCIHGTEGWCINRDIASAYMNHPFYDDWELGVSKGRVLKYTFGSTLLADIIKENLKEIDEVIFMGVCTDICVVSNVLLVRAYCPDLKITVDASCCAGSTPERHKAALETMKSCQIEVINEQGGTCK